MQIKQPKNIDLYAAQKILLLGVHRLGDMLFATPAIRMLQDALPQVQLDIAVTSGVARQVMLHNPAIENVHVVYFRWQLKRLAKKYDAILPLHDNGFNRDFCRRVANAFMYERDSGRVHMRQHPANFVRAILSQSNLSDPMYYQLYPQPKHFQRVASLLVAKAVQSDRDVLIGCHMGCRRVAIRGARLFKGPNVAGDTKSWEFANFVQLIERFNETHPQVKFALTGTKGEARIARKYLPNMPNTVDLIGQTSVLELAALMRECAVFLTGDTGPLHVACATDVPIVALHGRSSDPACYGPYPLGPHRIVLYKPKSVDDIAVDEVAAALTQLLGSRASIPTSQPSSPSRRLHACEVH